MRGLKLIDGRITVCTASLELSPHCGDIQKEPLGILLGGSFLLWINYRGKYNLLSMKCYILCVSDRVIRM